MADQIRYEHKTVRTVRGTDSLVISTMQKEGWEVVDRAQGTLRSTLTFRRPKKPVPWPLIGAAAAVAVIVAAVIGIGAAFSDEDKSTNESNKTTAVAKPSSPFSPTPTESPAAQVITSQNNPKFAALLKLDYCDEANLDFASKHQGETIAFNGSIVDMAPHGEYKTRYDLLLGVGKKGPAFKYEDVNIGDLNLTGTRIPATVGEGDRFRFVAEVVEFNATQCLFHLKPISTEVR